jgi:hypothetical protein
VTRFDQLQLQVRAQAKRIAALEVAVGARPVRPRRTAAPRPEDSDMDERDGWWAEYLLVEMAHGRGTVRLTKAAFAIRHGIPVSEFYRFFFPRDKRGIPKDSGPYLRIRSELIAARDSHGTARASHIFPVNAAVRSPHGEHRRATTG